MDRLRASQNVCRLAGLKFRAEFENDCGTELSGFRKSWVDTECKSRYTQRAEVECPFWARLRIPKKVRDAVGFG
jgi:hypothetical protein